MSEELRRIEADLSEQGWARDYLAAMVARASGELLATFHTQLSSSDALFLSATVEDPDGRVARYHRDRADDGWWWSRRPATGPLADYLAENYTSSPAARL